MVKGSPFENLVSIWFVTQHLYKENLHGGHCSIICHLFEVGESHAIWFVGHFGSSSIVVLRVVGGCLENKDP